MTCSGAHCFARNAIVVAKHHDASRSCANRVDRKVAILTDCVVFEKKKLVFDESLFGGQYALGGE